MSEEKTPLKWKIKTRDLPQYQIVVDGVVYLECKDNCLYAINSQDGEEKWKSKIEGGVELGTTEVSEGMVYFGSDDNHLYALNAKTGEEKWKFKTGDCISSYPTISKGVVYFGSDDNHLYALDAKTGEEKWKVKNQYIDYPGVSDGIVFFASYSSELYDDEEWRSCLLALDAKTGAKKWWLELGESVASSPAELDGIVYFGCKDEYLYAVDSKTGEEKWKFKAGDWGDNVFISDGVVYLNSFDGNLYAIDSKTGEEKWKVKAGDWISSDASDENFFSVSDGVIYFFNYEINYVYALDNQTIKEQQLGQDSTDKPLKKNEVNIKIDELYKRLVVAIRNDTSADYSDALDLSDEELMSDIEKYCLLSAGTFTVEEIEKKIDNGLFNLQNWYQNEWPLDGLSGFKEDWRLNEINPDWNATVYNLVNDLDPNSILDYH